jgi:hypothetical protein
MTFAIHALHSRPFALRQWRDCDYVHATQRACIETLK